MESGEKASEIHKIAAKPVKKQDLLRKFPVNDRRKPQNSPVSR